MEIKTGKYVDFRKTTWDCTRIRLEEVGWEFLGYSTDVQKDACFVMGKPAPPETEPAKPEPMPIPKPCCRSCIHRSCITCEAPTPKMTWYGQEITPAMWELIQSGAAPLFCPHCGAVLVTSSRGDWLSSGDIKRYSWHCPYCEAPK